MYSLTEIKVIHLEITSKCQASCPMCARNIQGGPINPFLQIDEITYDKFVKWFSEDLIKQLDRIYVCGNYGDPIISRDILQIFTYIRQHNPKINLSINTNGSARNKEFWERLAELNVCVRFGIDGLKDTHSKYRIGTDWQKIIDNATTFISKGGYAIWDMLVFDHNQHQVDMCRELSIQLGFKEFYHKNTSRFRDNHLDVINFVGKKIDTLYPTVKSKSYTEQVSTDSKEISCKAKNEKSIYVSANGNVTPCCWTDIEFLPHNNPSRIDIMTRIGSAPNLNKTTLAELFVSKSYFSDIENTWECDPLKECAKQCGRFKKFQVQYD